MARHGGLIGVALDNADDVLDHALLGLQRVLRVDLVEAGVMPNFDHVLGVDSDALLVNPKRSDTPGESLVSVECLVVDVQDIREGDVGDVGEPHGDPLGVELA